MKNEGLGMVVLARVCSRLKGIAHVPYAAGFLRQITKFDNVFKLALAWQPKGQSNV